MSQRNKQAPSNWNTYEHGRTSSVGSLNSISEDDAQQENHGTASSPIAPSWFRSRSDRQDGEQNLRPRRSSVFQSIRQMGGVNNIDNFARSYQRAQGFRDITPVRRNSVSFSAPEDDQIGSDTANTTGRSLPNKSLLRQQFEAAQREAAQRESPEMAITDAPVIQVQSAPSETDPLLPGPGRLTDGSLIARSHRDTIDGADFGSSFGSISARLTTTAQRRASILIQQQVEASLRAREAQEAGEDIKDDFMDRQVDLETRPDGEVIERMVGESTVPMTVFNSINVLIGVGILALPLAMRYSGWVLGIILVTLPAILTNYTARLLAKCLDTNSGSTTYGDLAYLAFGDVGRAIVEALFVVELLAANVAMLILFGDSMNSLVSGVANGVWKILLAIVLIPLNFVPFRVLSVTSILGIVCTISIIIVIFVDGFIKPAKPGSLRDFMPTYAFPQNWRVVPLSIGLFVAPWGGHSVFPAVYKDMRHPQKYTKALRSTYLVTYGLDVTMAIFGYLMFGDIVREEISINILVDPTYPKVLSVILVCLIAVIPITKIPLSARPIMDTVNKKFMIDLRQMDAKARQLSEKSWKHRAGRGFVGIMVNVLALGAAILFPDFDSIMATFGSSVCITICAILPISFYLKIFSSEGKEISKMERIMDYILLVIAAAFAIVGTIFAILPKSTTGAEACNGVACLGR